MKLCRTKATFKVRGLLLPSALLVAIGAKLLATLVLVDLRFTAFLQ